MNIRDIKQKLRGSEHILRERFFVKKIGVFGSYSKGEQRKKSDIDILVEFYKEPSLLKFINLENFLSKLLNKKVDLVMKNALKYYIGKHILREVDYL